MGTLCGGDIQEGIVVRSKKHVGFKLPAQPAGGLFFALFYVPGFCSAQSKDSER
jgi:hypothetical protein